MMTLSAPDFQDERFFMIFPFCLPVPSENQEADSFTAKNHDTLYKMVNVTITNKDCSGQVKKQPQESNAVFPIIPFLP